MTSAAFCPARITKLPVSSCLKYCVNCDFNLPVSLSSSPNSAASGAVKPPSNLLNKSYYLPALESLKFSSAFSAISLRNSSILAITPSVSIPNSAQTAATAEETPSVLYFSSLIPIDSNKVFCVLSKAAQTGLSSINVLYNDFKPSKRARLASVFETLYLFNPKDSNSALYSSIFP